MITAWHENAFRIIGALWGESIGRQWISLTKGQCREALKISVMLA